MLRWWRRRHKVGVLAADLEVTRTLAVLRAENAKTVPDINTAAPISDDGAIRAMVIGHTLIALRCCVGCAVLKIIVFIHHNVDLDLDINTPDAI